MACSSSYARVERDGPGRRVRTLVRELRHPSARRPPITLAGVTHIGLAEYYTQVQGVLDGQALVLYEMVMRSRAFEPCEPEALARAGDCTSAQRAALTRLNQQWLAVRLERYRRARGRYPGTLSELVQWLPRGAARVAMWAAVDGWGREHLYEASGDGFALTSLGADGRPLGEGDAADIRYSEGALPGRALRREAPVRHLARALGLVPQVDHIDVSGRHWVRCDRTLEELVAHARGEHPVCAGRGGTGARDREGLVRLMRVLQGDVGGVGAAALHRALSAVCLAVSWSPGLRRAARVLVCDALDAAAHEEAGDSADAAGDDWSATIVDFRDDFVVRSLCGWIGESPMPGGVDHGPKPDGSGVPASIGVLYGAEHMRGIEAGLRAVGYEPAGDRWLTAIEVRPDGESGRWDVFGRIAESLAGRL